MPQPKVNPSLKEDPSPTISSYPTDFRFHFFSSLKFDNTTSLSAEDFLLRINEKRKASKISEEELLLYLPELFQDTPLNWCRLEIDNWTQWNDFETAFRATFFPPNYQEKLKKEIEKRTQGEYEKILDFAISLKTLMKKLTHPLSEPEQISNIYNNLLPKYQLYIRKSEVTSVAHLMSLGQEFERIEDRAKTFRPPPPVDRSMFPEAAYKPSSLPKESSKKMSSIASVQQAYSKQQRPKKPKTKNNASTNSAKEETGITAIEKKNDADTSSKIVCWNCLENGHRYPACIKTRTIFCYHCGTQGITRKHCPNCNKGN